jgi:hypothetical protein
MGMAGYGWGAAEALRQIQKDRQEQVTEGLRAKMLMEQLASSAEDRKARADERRTQNAAIAVSQARPGDELSPDFASQIQGTPYAARLETKQTLPSSTIPIAGGANISDRGGRTFVNLRPTVQQEQAQGQQTAKRNFVDLVKRGAPRNQIISAMADAGGNVPESAFDDPNLGHTQRMQEIAAQGEQSRRTALTSAGAARAAAPIGPRDRVSARRQADAAASDYLDSMARASGGFLPATVDPDAIRAQFVDAYMAELEPAAASQANTDRALINVRQVMPRPYGSRQTPNTRLVSLRPRTSAAQADPYEQYLARQRGQ